MTKLNWKNSGQLRNQIGSDCEFTEAMQKYYNRLPHLSTGVCLLQLKNTILTNMLQKQV